MLHQALALAKQAARLDQRAARQARHDYETVFSALLRRLQEAYGPALSSVRVLDFGCGFTYPLVVLLRPYVREIVGVDVAPVYRDGWEPALLSRSRITPAAVAQGALDYLRAGCYFRHLEGCMQSYADHAGYRIVRYNGRRLPFPAHSFDCVISNAVLQELPEPLEPFAEEMARVLRPGGRLDVEWHNFYSWSGHYLGEEESRRHPWGHLRGGKFHPSLNRMSPERVASAFGPWFANAPLLRHDRNYQIAGRDPEYREEGLDALTTEIREDLAHYPREWLLTRGYILQASRRKD